MRKIALKISLFISLICITACTTTQSVVSDSANLEKYNYATIVDVMNYTGSATLMNLEVEIYDALSNTRLQVLGDKQVESLSDIQKQKLLLVRFSASQNESESVVSINFTDFSTGSPIASCRGAYNLGWTPESNTRKASKKAIEQMKSLFQRKTGK